MFKEATDLELALLYRALNTEYNLVYKLYQKDVNGVRLDTPFSEQLNALQHLLDEQYKESERRYLARLTEARYREDYPV